MTMGSYGSMMSGKINTPFFIHCGDKAASLLETVCSFPLSCEFWHSLLPPHPGGKACQKTSSCTSSFCVPPFCIDIFQTPRGILDNKKSENNDLLAIWHWRSHRCEPSSFSLKLGGKTPQKQKSQQNSRLWAWLSYWRIQTWTACAMQIAPRFSPIGLKAQYRRAQKSITHTL